MRATIVMSVCALVLFWAVLILNLTPDEAQSQNQDHLVKCYVIAQNCIDGMEMLKKTKASPEEKMMLMSFCISEWTDNSCAKYVYEYKKRREGV